VSITADPELKRLLIEELVRHLVTLEARPVDAAQAVRAVHALKGSAGLVGERELASALERIHRRMRDGEARAFMEATEVVRTAITRLRAGESAMVARWPEPPDDLAGRPLEPLVRAQYAAEVADRLARIDEALSVPEGPLESVATIYRQVHTIKGAASAVGDEPMTWFTHGLEELLKGVSTVEEATKLLEELPRFRALVGALLDDPDAALRTLRSSVSIARRASGPPATSPGGGASGPSSTAASTTTTTVTRSSVAPLDDEPPRSMADEATIRVATASIDRLLERLEAIDLVRERVGVRAERAKEIARYIRTFRGGLVEALRLIGPPRPWGAPAAALRRIEDAVGALGVIGEEIDGAGGGLRASDHALRDALGLAKKQLSAMRLLPVGRIFARLTTAIESESRRMDRAVIVRTRGADEMIDRRVAEQLVEPCLQLVRNAVAHGIEDNEVRVAHGKPPAGTIAFTARKVGTRLRITIEDDGAGVDLEAVKERAVDAGMVTREAVDAADEDALVSLLFVAGFSTRQSSDVLAGRGIGLDIARTSVQKMGGTIRVSSRRREGFTARIDVPIESGVTTVLWVRAAGDDYAIPTQNVLGVRASPEGASKVVHLVTCLEGRLVERAAFAVMLDLQGEDAEAPEPIALGIDAVGRTEEVLVRPLSPLVAGLGPYAGAVARGNAGLRLALDAFAVGARARALARTEARPSSSPPSSIRRVY
jgi:two-component system chemotaxis sensor kinase CheA